jgi:hypothetical protein
MKKTAAPVAGKTFTAGSHLAAGTAVKTATGSFRVGHFAKASPAVVYGKNAPSRKAFLNPNEGMSTHNYPRPHSGNTYITNNTTIINNNYRWDSTHYAPHVANFYGVNDPVWGNHWRYGCYQPSGISVSFGFGFYAYTPYYAPVVASPWYYYPYVPAYVPQAQVVVLSNYSCNWDTGSDYVYASGDDPDFNACVSYFHGFYVGANFGNLSLISRPPSRIRAMRAQQSDTTS